LAAFIKLLFKSADNMEATTAKYSVIISLLFILSSFRYRRIFERNDIMEHIVYVTENIFIWRYAMKNKNLLLFMLLILVFSCRNSEVFEMEYQGIELEKPIDTKRLYSAIQISLKQYNWSIVSDSDGIITAKYVKGAGKYSATIQIIYSAEGYSCKYVDSKNLKANLETMRIHPVYKTWIKNLKITIANNYYEMKP
jgi:uncharacterized integral membrane protein